MELNQELLVPKNLGINEWHIYIYIYMSPKLFLVPLHYVIILININFFSLN